MNRSRVVSAEKTDNFLKFDPNSVTVDIDNAVNTRFSSNGMFIPIKYSYPHGITSFKLQTPEVSGYLTDCDPDNNPGKQYKTSLLLHSTNIDPTFSEEDLVFQKETVEILDQFKNACIAQLKKKKQEFDKKTQKKINSEAWNYMTSSFEVVRPHVKNNNTCPCTNYYINPKITNNKNFGTSFIFKNNEISFERAVQLLLNKKFYCVAVFSVDSLFFQSASSKIFAQAKLESIVITRSHSSAVEKVFLPSRLQSIQTDDTSSDEEKDDLEKTSETTFDVDTPSF